MAAKFGYQFIKKIEVTKIGYYTLSIKGSANSNAVAETWEMHAKERDAQEQIAEMCRRALWFLDYKLPVVFSSRGTRSLEHVYKHNPESDWTDLQFAYEPGPKPAAAGNGLPSNLHMQSRQAEEAGFDSQLDALSGLLSDMKGIQEATASELSSQDTLIAGVMDKVDSTNNRLKKASAQMVDIEKNM